MPTTITSYPTFVPNTRARATEMNTVTGNHRGTLIPINSDTQSASHLVHDLGTTEHRWLGIYAATIDLVGSTSTTNLQIIPNTSSTLGGWALQAGTSTAKCLHWNSNTASILLYGATIASFNSSGFIANNVTPMGATTSAAVGDFAISATFTSAYNTTGSFVTVASITLVTNGRPVMVGLISAGTVAGGAGMVQHDQTAGSANLAASIMFGRDSTEIGYSMYRVSDTNTTGVFNCPSGAFYTYDFPAAGTYTYSVAVRVESAGDRARISNSRLYARQI